MRNVPERKDDSHQRNFSKNCANLRAVLYYEFPTDGVIRIGHPKFLYQGQKTYLNTLVFRKINLPLNPVSTGDPPESAARGPAFQVKCILQDKLFSMKRLSVITDPVYIKPDNYSAFDKFWLSKIRDEKDLPFIYLTLRITFLMIPVGLLHYFIPFGSLLFWGVTLFYFYLNNFVFKGPFGLMLHCTSHRPWFKKENKLLNYYLPWIVGPFFGQSPETYYGHHIGMHHPENNLEDDDSSTMHFQRDSFSDFMKYFARFLFTGLINTFQYFHRRNRTKLKIMLIRGEMALFIFWVLLSLINFPATFFVFMLPFILSRFIMMLGNWTQHAFVDYDEPGNLFKSSITTINVPYNHKCWNDGYHTSHHIKPGEHYTRYPIHFQENIKQFVRERALVFEGVDYLQIWWHLMHKNYQKLADHLVNIDGMWESEEEAISVMKSRTRKMPARGITMDALRQRA